MLAKVELMKIAHLTTGHHPFDTRIFQKQCKSLSAAGHEVYLVVPHDKDVVEAGVRIKAITITRSRFKRIIISPWFAYSVAAGLDAEVYHLHDPDLIPVGLALKCHNKLVIFDSHEDFPADIMSKEWIPVKIRKYIKGIYTNFEKYALRKFDAVITVHEQIYSRIIQYQTRTFVVKNFPILNAYFHVEKLKLQKFVWMGMLCPIRGSSQMDEAIKMQKNAKIDVIGTVLDFQPSDENIELLGTYPQEKAMQIASNYLAGLVTYLPAPNHIDSLPNKMFEYMALGLPVIASDFPKWRKIIEGADCGVLVNPNSPQEIAQAMQWMLNNQHEAFEMGKRGRKAVEEKYSWQSEEKKLIAIYGELVK